MDLGEMVTKEVGKVIGDMAIFFVKKQCRDIGVDVRNLKHTDLPRLADKLEKAVANFTGQSSASQMKRDILAIQNT